MSFAVGDIVVIAQKAQNPNAAANLFVGQDAEVQEIRVVDHHGTRLLRVAMLGHVLPPQFWVDESMLEPEVTEAMVAAAREKFSAAAYLDDDQVVGIYNTMRAVRRDKTKASR